MSWIIKALIWSRMLVYALLTTGVTGSVFYLLMRLFIRVFKTKNPNVLLFWQKNELADRSGWLAVFEEYKRRFALPNVRLYQNPLVLSPVVAKRKHFMIVLPEQAYTEKELHMILAHEMNHIRHRDLFWRKAAICAGWINWYLPLPGFLQRELVCQQEIICDLRSGTGNPAFSQREYGQFLVSMTDNGWDRAQMMALCESENIMMRRLEMMTQAKKMKKTKRWFAAATCAGLTAFAMLLAETVSVQAIVWEENRIYESEDATEDQPQEWGNPGEEHTEYADMSVTEIDLSGEAAGYSSIDNINREIAVNTRILYTNRSMSAGDKVYINTFCEDENAVYRIGVKNKDMGKVSYIEGTGVLAYTYTVQTGGNYAAYVENRSSRTIKVTGAITYKQR